VVQLRSYLHLEGPPRVLDLELAPPNLADYDTLLSQEVSDVN
jgi:hypothetical protein